MLSRSALPTCRNDVSLRQALRHAVDHKRAQTAAQGALGLREDRVSRRGRIPARACDYPRAVR
eukprot:10170128-Alexandrium_andersonii.AAC.1